MDREAVRRQLRHILAHPLFTTSRRYPALLSYVVEATLEGHRESLKERTLGIEVFHRDPSYDTNADPVVRIAACEVRKRLAQYYQERTEEQAILIELPQGSYVPKFRICTGKNGETAAFPSAEQDGTALGMPVGIRSRLQKGGPIPLKAGNHAIYPLVAFCLLFGAAIGFGGAKLRPLARTSTLNEFWQPFLDSPKPVLLCVGQLYAPKLQLEPSGPTEPFGLPLTWWQGEQGNEFRPLTTLKDATVLASIVGILRAKEGAYAVRASSDVSLSDLRQGPVVMVGAFNNNWTVWLNDQLRYYFDLNPTSRQSWIGDRQDPSHKIGVHVNGVPGTEMQEDYAIVSRVYNPTAQQEEVALAGITGDGTLAAGRFVTNPRYLEDFAKRAPANWQQRNMQVVIAVSIADGSPGPPRIVATYVW